MTGAIVGIVVLYCFVVYVGRHVRKFSYGSNLFIMAVAAAQVAVVLYFIFTAKNPAL